MRFNKKLQPQIKVLNANPRDEDAQQAVEKFYAKKGRWPDLAKVWEQLGKDQEASEGWAGAAHFYALAGQVWQGRIGDVERARSCWERSLEHAADDAIVQRV